MYVMTFCNPMVILRNPKALNFDIADEHIKALLP